MRDLSRITARLQALGHTDLLYRLQDGLAGIEEIPFASIASAKSFQRLLYNWLWFYPEAKAKVSMRLNETTMVMTLFPRGIPEKRGRKHR